MIFVFAQWTTFPLIFFQRILLIVHLIQQKQGHTNLSFFTHQTRYILINEYFFFYKFRFIFIFNINILSIVFILQHLTKTYENFIREIYVRNLCVKYCNF